MSGDPVVEQPTVGVDECGRTRRDCRLARGDLDEMFREYRISGDRELRNRLVLAYRWIPERSARRFSGRGEPIADLIQVGELALVRAVERFDPDVGSSFPKFAVPTVLGELKRHFRDKTWRVSVPRRSKDLVPRMNTAAEELQRRTGHTPSPAELAAYMQVDTESVREALRASRAYRPASTDQPNERQDDPAPRESQLLRCDDSDLENADVRASVRRAARCLDTQARYVLLWRFYEGCTQTEIGDRLGVGQVHVSRLIRRSLNELKDKLSDLNDDMSSASPA